MRLQAYPAGRKFLKKQQSSLKKNNNAGKKYCCKPTDNLKPFHYRKKLYVMNDVILYHSKKPASVKLVR